MLLHSRSAVGQTNRWTNLPVAWFVYTGSSPGQRDYLYVYLYLPPYNGSQGFMVSLLAHCSSPHVDLNQVSKPGLKTVTEIDISNQHVLGCLFVLDEEASSLVEAKTR